MARPLKLVALLLFTLGAAGLIEASAKGGLEKLTAGRKGGKGEGGKEGGRRVLQAAGKQAAGKKTAGKQAKTVAAGKGKQTTSPPVTTPIPPPPSPSTDSTKGQKSPSPKDSKSSPPKDSKDKGKGSPPKDSKDKGKGSPPPRPRPPTTGEVRFNGLMRFLNKNSPTYDRFIDFMEYSGFNETLIDLMDNKKITILLPTNNALPARPNLMTYVRQRLGYHVFIGMYTGKDLTSAKSGQKFDTADTWPSLKPGLACYKISSKITQFSSGAGDSTGIRLSTPNAYKDTGGVWGHAIDFLMTPPRFYNKCNGC